MIYLLGKMIFLLRIFSVNMLLASSILIKIRVIVGRLVSCFQDSKVYEKKCFFPANPCGYPFKQPPITSTETAKKHIICSSCVSLSTTRLNSLLAVEHLKQFKLTTQTTINTLKEHGKGIKTVDSNKLQHNCILKTQKRFICAVQIEYNSRKKSWLKNK